MTGRLAETLDWLYSLEARFQRIQPVESFREPPGHKVRDSSERRVESKELVSPRSASAEPKLSLRSSVILSEAKYLRFACQFMHIVYAWIRRVDDRSLRFTSARRGLAPEAARAPHAPCRLAPV